MNEDKIIQKLLEHDQKFEKIEENFVVLRNEFLTGQDKIMKILTRLDNQRLFTFEATRRTQDELDEQKTKIARHDISLKRIKEHLHII